jgi:hypothetical protein
MRQLTTTLAAAALAVTGVTHATARTASAQSGTTPVSFGISGGPSLPTTEDLNSGFQVAGHLGFRSRTSPLGVRFDVLYDNWGIERGGGELRAIGGTANLMIHLPSTSTSVRPYLSGGIGIYNTKYSMVDEGETNGGLNAGAGLDFPMSGIIPFAEVRFHSVFTDVRKTNFVPIVFGVRF